MSNEISEQCNAWFMNPPLHVQDDREKRMELQRYVTVCSL